MLNDEMWFFFYNIIMHNFEINLKVFIVMLELQY